VKTVTPPDTDARVAARIETVREGGRTVARVAFVPTGAVRAGDLLDDLDAAERQRAERFQSHARRDEFIVSRWLLAHLAPTGPTSIAHCRRWVAVAETPGQRIGLDVESRLPRHLDAVGERLGWGALGDSEWLQAWTLWEAWRKLEGGSVLDAPDAVYAEVLRVASDLYTAPRIIAGATWFSRALDGGVLSIAVRDR
jgi:hypothetical protein